MEKQSAVPANIAEFNQIVALVFAQLYAAFPVAVPHIDRDGIAAALDIPPGTWATHMLPSGRSFSEVMAYTFAWLASQNYIVASGSHPAERVVLSDKGLAALNAVPEKLSGSIGSQLVTKARSGNWGGIGDLVGSVLGSAAGSYQKAISS
jgi:hypothetical protein